jgi:hypothetical protein
MTKLTMKRATWQTARVQNNQSVGPMAPNPAPGARADTFEASRPAATIRRLLRLPPSLKTMSAESLASLVKDTAPNKINFSKLEYALLRTGPSDFEQLWYGVCLRLRGENPQMVLKPLLEHPVYARAALMNIVADFVSRPSVDSERAAQYLETLDAHIQVNVQDAFARLLQSILLYKTLNREQALEVVEQLYLDAPGYTPSLSLMASYLNIRGLGDGALSFAHEAFAKCPDNVQALAVLRYQKDGQNQNDIKARFAHVRRPISEIMPESILYCRYGMLDPLS